MSPNSSRFCAPALLLLTIDMEAQHTGVRGPLPVSALIAIPQQLAASSHIPWGEEPTLSSHPAFRKPRRLGERRLEWWHVI